MKKICFIVAVILTALVTSCGGSSTGWEEERDSIMSVNDQQREILDDLTETLVDVSASLDSITMQEKMLKDRMQESGSTKKQMLSTISSFKTLLAENKVRMAELEKKLSGRDDQLAKMSRLIQYLNEEIEKKEATINQLMEELSKKNVDIANLHTNIDNLNNTISNMQVEVDNQKKEIAKHTENINTVYYIMGDKDFLKKKGLLTGGFLSKKRVDYSNLDMTLFTAADKRVLHSLNIPSRSPKILSGVNQSACTINKTDKKNSELVINDPATFWSTSNVLIIQY